MKDVTNKIKIYNILGLCLAIIGLFSIVCNTLIWIEWPSFFIIDDIYKPDFVGALAFGGVSIFYGLKLFEYEGK